jgi:hypothetical protein
LAADYVGSARIWQCIDKLDHAKCNIPRSLLKHRFIHATIVNLKSKIQNRIERGYALCRRSAKKFVLVEN